MSTICLLHFNKKNISSILYEGNYRRVEMLHRAGFTSKVFTSDDI